MKAKVVYILGYGRSGSTLLDSILGNHHDIVNVGELVHLQREGWKYNHYCSCGRMANECEFWNKVKQDTHFEGGNNKCLEAYITEQKKLLKKYNIFLPKLIYKTVPSSKFLKGTRAVFSSISKNSGKDIIVDSSKLPTWGLLLSRLEGIELYCIHLVRDGRGVACSLNKHYEKDISAGIQNPIKKKAVYVTAINWLLYNLMSELLLFKIKVPSITIKYEDLVSDTELTVKTISEFIGVEDASILKNLQTAKIESPKHNIAGNRMRMKKEIDIKPDFSWRKKLNRVKKIVVWLLIWPLALKYGYKYE